MSVKPPYSDMWTESHYDNKLLTSQQHHYDAEKLSHHGYANVVDKATESHGNAHDQTTAIFDMDLKEIKKEAETIVQKENKLRNATKSHSTPLTLKWLDENYEVAEGVCIPRSTLYLHYLDFCEKNDSQPVNAASFGKIIRQQFPHLTTRRLGTRGQSKYHYYGIGITDHSPYYELKFSKHGVQHSLDGRKDSLKASVAYSPRSKLGTLLPEFPAVSDLTLPPDLDESKVNTFLVMYRTHCQRILDTVIRANFEEVQSFLLHFWQGMPAHIVPVLGTTVIVNLVGICDSILYKAIAGVLMPTVLQALPDSLTQVIRMFSRQLDEWLRLALEDLPQTLVNIKFNLARRFAQVLRRQTSLNHLCQAARTVIQAPDIVGQMLEDWGGIDLSSICKQTLYTMDNYSVKDHEVIIGFYKEFEHLMEEQSTLEAYTVWLDSLVHRCITQPAVRRRGTLRRYARQFLLMWSCFGTRVIRDMTLHSAPSFGSFHLLHLMFDDYILYVVENLHTQERANELLRALQGEQPHGSPADDLALPTPVTLISSSHNPLTPASPQYASNPLQAPQTPCPGDRLQAPQTPCSGDRPSVIEDNRELYNGYPRHSPANSSCDITTSLDLHGNSTQQQQHNYGNTNTLPGNNNIYSQQSDYTNPYTYSSCLQNKYSYSNRGGGSHQRPTADWSDAGYHRYSYLLSSGGSGGYGNYDNTDYTDMYGYSPVTTQVITPSNQGGGSTSRVNTHFQQGVIYSPYTNTYTTGASCYAATDNNNMAATTDPTDRKRKLEEETNMAAAAKRLVATATYHVPQYSVTTS